MLRILIFIICALFLKGEAPTWTSDGLEEIDLEDKLSQLNDENNKEIEQLLSTAHTKAPQLHLTYQHHKVQDNVLERLAKYDWPNVMCINLSTNAITGKGIEALKKIAPKLKALQVYSTHITTLAPFEQTVWPSLSELCLQNNKLELSAIESIAQRAWPHLRILDLRSCSLDDEKVEALMKKEFFPLSAAFKDIAEECFVADSLHSELACFEGVYREIPYPALEYLYLESNLIEYKGASSLKPPLFPELKELTLAFNPVDNEKDSPLLCAQWQHLESFDLRR